MLSLLKKADLADMVESTTSHFALFFKGFERTQYQVYCNRIGGYKTIDAGNHWQMFQLLERLPSKTRLFYRIIGK